VGGGVWSSLVFPLRNPPQAMEYALGVIGCKKDHIVDHSKVGWRVEVPISVAIFPL